MVATNLRQIFKVTNEMHLVRPWRGAAVVLRWGLGAAGRR